MERIADLLKDYKGSNPFRDNQARNFSDKKILSEFYPVSGFWSLFNDQHEVLLGTRGCGKTYLLKAMRYSMLKRIDHPRAKELIEKREFFAVYVAMRLEIINSILDKNLSMVDNIKRFQIFFNFSLAQAILQELKSYIEDMPELRERAICTFKLAYHLNNIWFNEENKKMDDLDSLAIKLVNKYYNTNWNEMEKLYPVFSGPICTSLIAVKKLISQILSWEDEPTWIICVDEAEFLNESFQQCINTVFRADSNRIALKVATLPFFHKTLKTLSEDVYVTNNNDFSYCVVDLNCQDKDFIDLTNKLVKHRIETRMNLEINCDSLEDFLGIVGKDDLIDYFRLEMGEELAQKDKIKEGIINSFSSERKKNSSNYSNQQKTIFDKFAPEYYIREIRKKNIGNHKIGWYAGAKVVRKVSQGNPRIFLELMNALCEMAKKQHLQPHIQHEVVYKFAKDCCEATRGIEEKGPIIYKYLSSISEDIENKVHNGAISTYGTSFKLNKNWFNTEDIVWIQVAIAYSKIFVDDETKKSGLKSDTKFSLANIFAVRYWIPMRNDTSIQVVLNKKENNSYTVKTQKENLNGEYQLSLDLEELK